MRTKRCVAIIIVLCVWSLISYYLLLRPSHDDSNSTIGAIFNLNKFQNETLRKLSKLETSIREQNELHDRLLKKIVRISQLLARADNVIRAGGAVETSLQNDVDRDAAVIEQLKLLNRPNAQLEGPIIPVLVFACNRISVRNCLSDLVKFRPNADQFPIIVTQVSSNFNLLYFMYAD